MNIKTSLELISAGERQQSLNSAKARQEEAVGEKLLAAAQGTTYRSQLGKTYCSSDMWMCRESSGSTGGYECPHGTPAQGPLTQQSVVVRLLQRFPRPSHWFCFVPVTSLTGCSEGGLQVEQAFVLAWCLPLRQHKVGLKSLKSLGF